MKMKPQQPQKLWDRDKAVLIASSTVIKVYLKKEEKPQINNLS